MRKRSKLRKKLKQNINAPTRQKIVEKIRVLEDKLKASVDKEMSLQEVHAVSCIKTNPKYFYKYAAGKSKLKVGVGPLTGPNGDNISDPQEITEILQAQYSSVFSIPAREKIIHSPVDFFQTQDNTASVLADITITVKDVMDAIKQISSNAAAGPDHFPALLLRKCAAELSVPLHILYKRSLNTGNIPMLWKTAVITPIHKGGSRAEASNYRPVALTSHVIKVLEKVIVAEITKYLEGQNKMNPDQHGFRAGRSCLSQLLAHHETILRALEYHKDMDVVYLDFSKAFDTVDHGILLHKVRQLGITGKLGAWLHCFLTNREQTVAVAGMKSRSCLVVSGVPQGSVLGPLLFLIHILDINQHIKHSQVSSFADDTRILKKVSCVADSHLLQDDLQALYTWAAENNMSFNSNKFVHMAYNIGKKSKLHTYLAPDGSCIETKDTVKDLGITLNSDGYFTVHITNVAKRARSQAGWILRTFTTRETQPMLTLFKALVVPLLEYCCQLWNPWKVGEKQLLEAVQRSFTYRIRAARHLTYWERLKELNLFSLERRRERYLILYVYKIMIGHTTNNLNLIFYDHQRLGRLCRIERVHPRATTRTKTLKENAFAIRGPLLYNTLPRHLRDPNNRSLESYKKDLDKFLWTIPDQPKLPHYHLRAESNSIIDQLALRRADGIY